MKHACLVFNPAAGRCDAGYLEILREALAAYFTLDVFTTTPECAADTCTAAALERGPDLIVAAGGDGTVSGVASRLLGTGVPLGILPCGTSCSIARALSIPLDLDGACANLADGMVRRLDAARVDGRVMVLLCAIGLHADAVGETDPEQKQRWGKLAYVATGLRKLTELEPFQLELVGDDHIVRCKATAVTVANMAPPTTALAQGPSVVSPDDGLLDVTVMAAASPGEMVAAGLHLLRTALQGEPATRDDVGYLSSRRLRIVTDPPQRVLVDGELVGQTPITIECLPRSLAVVVPASPPAREAPEEKLEGLPELEVVDRR
jgi:YegS/Rv2252/BmrU family lipid kinase